MDQFKWISLIVRINFNSFFVEYTNSTQFFLEARERREVMNEVETTGRVQPPTENASANPLHSCYQL